MNSSISLFLPLFLTISINLFAQEKFESERSIKRSEVPTNALLFIDSLKTETRIKWYEEEGLTKKSFEAKFKLNRVKYSVEFDTLGIIEDVEMEFDWLELSDSTARLIKAQMNDACVKHKIRKVQKQFIGSEHDLFNLLRQNIWSDSIDVNYEIVVKCKNQSETNLFEYLFTDEGELLNKSKIVFKNSSHLEY